MHLQEYTPSCDSYIADYYLSDEMKHYTSLPQECILLSKENPLFHSILSFSEDILVTFLVLDESKEKMAYTNKPNTLLLRSFSTDSRHLKKGYAKQTLLLLNNFVKNQYPHIEEIILAVNEKNVTAQSLYLKAGFIDTGKRINGIKGELMILTKEIN